MKKYHFLFLHLLMGYLLSAQNLPILIPVVKSNKWGFTDRKMHFVIKPTYDAIVYPFTAYEVPNTNRIDTLAYVKEGEEKFFINKKGLKIEAPKGFSHYDRLDAPTVETSVFDEEQERARIKKEEFGIINDSISGKKGIRNQRTGAIIVEPQYDGIRKIFSNLDNSYDLYSVNLKKKYGVITTTGKVVLNLEYDFIEGVRYFDENYTYCFTVRKDQLVCVINDKNNTLVCSDNYIDGGGSGIQHIGLFTGKKDKLRYLYDYAKQQFINKIGYNEIDYSGYQEGLLQVKRGNKTFYIDEKGIEFQVK
ncbi:MAG: hypothetical protein RIQ59_699 [Bacteroidota bacterium]|jgi:hypothetical protein